MTTEEKAKAYDEALKVIKGNLEAINEITGAGTEAVNIQAIKNCFYKAFPELKESEDERIRKEMINFLKSEKAFRTIDLSISERWIAWLETQPAEWSEEDEAKLIWLCRIIHSHRLHGLLSLKEESELGKWIDKWINHEPQHEKKWRKEDAVFLNEIIDFFENKTVKLQHDLDMYAHWLKSLPERFNL